MSSSGQVRDGVDLVNRAGASLGEIVQSIRQVAGIVSDIAGASAEQATGLEQVSKALGAMDEVTQRISALVEQNAATAKTLKDQQAAMRERMGFFSLGRPAIPAQKVVARTVATAVKPLVKPATRPAGRRAASAPPIRGRMP